MAWQRLMQYLVHLLPWDLAGLLGSIALLVCLMAFLHQVAQPQARQLLAAVTRLLQLEQTVRADSNTGDDQDSNDKSTLRGEFDQVLPSAEALDLKRAVNGSLQIAFHIHRSLSVIPRDPPPRAAEIP